MQGLALEFFVDQHYAEVYQCSICQRVPTPENAAHHEKCGAVYCKKCLETWLTKEHSCPKCRGTIVISMLKDHNMLAYQLHQRLELKCPAGDRCPWKGCISALSAHRADCDYLPNACRFAVAGCSFNGTKSELAAHEASSKDMHLDQCFASLQKFSPTKSAEEHKAAETLQVAARKKEAESLKREEFQRSQIQTRDRLRQQELERQREEEEIAAAIAMSMNEAPVAPVVPQAPQAPQEPQARRARSISGGLYSD